MAGQVVCSACGAVAADSDRFCMSCGKPLGEPADVMSAAASTSAPGPSGSASYHGRGAAPTQQSGGGGLGGVAYAASGLPEYDLPSAAEVQQRFKSLRLIATIFTVLAWIVIVLGAIAVLISAARASGALALVVLIVGAIAVAIDALFLFAAAAFIRLMIGIEENTRVTADTLMRRVLASRA